MLRPKSEFYFTKQAENAGLQQLQASQYFRTRKKIPEQPGLHSPVEA